MRTSLMKKYLQIKERILSEIRTGGLKPGDQLPVREDLIKRFQVTRATLSKALDELKKENWLVAYRNRGTFVSEPPSIKRIALISKLQVDNQPMAKVRHAHQMEALSHVVLSSSKYKIDLFDTTIIMTRMDDLSAYDVIVWLHPGNHEIDQLRRYQHKSLLVNRYVDDFNYVSTNHRQALFDMTDHFINQNGTSLNLIYLDLSEDNFVTRERRKGFIEACEKNAQFYRTHPIRNNSFNEKVSSLMELELPMNKRNVIISPSQMFTGAVLHMAYLRDFRIGRDFHYSDFDNATSLELSGVPIPSVLQDYEKMGTVVVEAIGQLRDKPFQQFIPHHFINI